MGKKVIVAEGNNSEVYMGKTDYFTVYKTQDGIKLVDLSGNYTVLDKQELKEMIDLLNKGYSKIK